MSRSDGLIGYAIRPLLLATLLPLGGCTTLDPIFASKQLMTSKHVDLATGEQAFYGDLPRVIDQVTQLRYELVSAVRSETALTQTVGALLIPLSAVAMYKGMTDSGSSTERWLTAAGLTGAAAYTYANTFTSKPRLRVYLAGAQALSCAVLASRPFLYTTVDIEGGQSCAGCSAVTGLRPAVRQLAGLIAKAQQGVDASLARVNSRRQELGPVTSASGTQRCAAATRPSIATIGTDPDDATRLSTALQAERARAQRNCQRTSSKANKSDVEARLDELLRIENTLRSYKAEITTARAARADGDKLLARIANAGTDLREHAVGIQNQVNEEVLKLQPEPAAILQALGGMRSLGFQISGASRLAPQKDATIGAQRGPGTGQSKRPTDEAMLTDLQGAENVMDDLRAAESELRNYLNLAQALSTQTAKLAQCKLVLPAGQMSIVPDVDQVFLAAGGTQVFLVSGANGAPIAEVAGAGTEKVITKVEVAGSAHKISVSLKENQALGEQEILYLHIADGSGQQRVINLTGGGTATGQGGPSEPSTIKEATRKALCTAFALGDNCLASPAVMACRKLIDQNVAQRITEDEARKVTTARIDGPCRT
ncbi:MAG: hypothetical protein DVS81_01180 [Candidatus Accumulibacter meliphilus]|jgi:hypothetical protein|uniref:Uncharacterized protein n=1 Tax=Candidatus Accumulibacter meliphilus TaxID=2211374 RepID=A0A369XUF5_9PROT|nr:MAG: hypothetical protein DVS81_01180 [Candidatus Accumulibacter meliphilus]